MSADIAFSTIEELGAQLRNRQLSCEEVVRATLHRIERLDRQLNTFITLLPEQAIAQAKAVDAELAAGRFRGPLHGIPCSVKDHMDTAGVRTTSGAKSRLSNIPTTDAVVVRRLKQGGAVLIGKANMNKFAEGDSGENADFGRIGNPWSPTFSPGGSSGGSGAQVAAGMVPLSVGSDNGGSIRIPAALCGVVGLKPTHGRVSLEGIFPRLYSLDHAGPLTRSVTDCAIALQALAGHEADDTTTARKAVPDYSQHLRDGIKGMSIGVDRAYCTLGEPDLLAALAQAVDTLRSLGASIVDVSFTGYDQCLAVGNTLSACEDAVAGAKLLRDHPEDYEGNRPPASTAADIKAGLIIPAVDYIRATQQRRLLQVAFARATKDVSLVVCPTYSMAPRPYGDYPRLRGRQYTGADALYYTFIFDVLGLPALSVPCGFSPAGSPIGLQFIAKPFDEATALRAAYAYEQATPWHTRHPPLPGLSG
jgi:aspartyl-tRNA(Asn)/glutamyl-tRNA(Gln) amidotransferase subunit A